MKKIIFYIFTAIFALNASLALAVEQTSEDNFTEPQVVTTSTFTADSNDDGATEHGDGDEEEASDGTNSNEDVSSSEDETEPTDTSELSDDSTVSPDGETVSFQKKIQAQKEALEAKKEQIQNQVEATQAQLEQKKGEAKERLEEKKAVMEQRKAEFKERLTEKRRSLVNAYSERMGKRLSAALERLSILTDRLEDRIKKLSETLGDKLDPTEALSNIKKARTMIGLLQVDIEETVAEVDAAFDSTDPQASFSNAKTALREIVKGIKDIHKLLVNTISSLRAQPSLIETTDTDDTTDEETGDEDSSDEETEDEDETNEEA